ncbi:Putative hemolysin [Solimonas aquatica]|uniref:L-ornithine N(alpha)-acyltransferase n=1 Tax=Solimonas aquatica TaxID=489703 RepID=A0A1H9JZE2_9GAMM|nr:GNAT family N-acyltransferase [Solimonas aquatica]SEQ92190.1 Putative hemolysin [Solimonas aquatica]
MSARIDGDLPRRPRFEVRFAQTQQEVLATQQLRYRIFAEELGAQIDGGQQHIDHDQYDPHCRHLLVRDADQDRIIACTRILSDVNAAAAGGFYSAGEFDLAMLDSLPGRLMEIGRTCVDAEYRSGAVIATLWQGIAGIITNEGYDYLFGCASIGLEDGGAQAQAILQQISDRHMAPDYQRVRPYIRLPAPDRRSSDKPRLPPLLKAYLSLGAKACGEAYWDREFNCADVFMLLNVQDLNPRYARHFLGSPARECEPVALAA